MGRASIRYRAHCASEKEVATKDEKDSIEPSETSPELREPGVQRRELFGALGALGAIVGLGSLAGCRPGEVVPEVARSAAYSSGTDITWVDTKSDLLGVSPSSYSTVIMRGYHAAGDGGGGVF